MNKTSNKYRVHNCCLPYEVFSFIHWKKMGKIKHISNRNFQQFTIQCDNPQA